MKIHEDIFIGTCLRWVLCLVASPGLWDLQVDLDLAENVDLLLYFKILHRNKETAWTNKYMDVISKDEPFRCESFSFFEQLGRKLIFSFLHKRSIFCSFPNFSWKFNIHSFHRLKWAMNRLFIFNIDRVISFLRLGSKHFLPDLNRFHDPIRSKSSVLFYGKCTLYWGYKLCLVVCFYTQLDTQIKPSTPAKILLAT